MEQGGDLEVFAILYLGGVAFAALPAVAFTEWAELDLSLRQVAALLFLGILPSGLAFFLWNVGVRRVGVGTVSVMNNAKVPLAV